MRGVCLAHNREYDDERGYGSAWSLASKKELVALGADWISVTAFGHQEALESRQVTFDPLHHESDARLEAEVAQAHKLGFKVMHKPHMHINPSLWRGHIEPTGPDGWDAWFEGYTTFILHHAQLAARLEVEAFVVGLELASTSWYHRKRWVTLIDAVREVYPGMLVYAANWNEAQRVVFWDKVDAIGIQFFPPLSEAAHPTAQELRVSIDHHFDQYDALAREHNKPIILTEFGYKAIQHTTSAPNTWPQHLPAEARVTYEHNQALAYAVLLEAVAARERIAGLFVWKWFTDVDTDPEGAIGFSPRGRQAAGILRKAFAAKAASE